VDKFVLLTIYNYTPNTNITIILLSLRFSDILAADENKQVFVYVAALLLEIIEGHLSPQYQDGYKPLTADEELDLSQI
jgi:hypothetical protein